MTETKSETRFGMTLAETEGFTSVVQSLQVLHSAIPTDTSQWAWRIYGDGRREAFWMDPINDTNIARIVLGPGGRCDDAYFGRTVEWTHSSNDFGCACEICAHLDAALALDDELDNEI